MSERLVLVRCCDVCDDPISEAAVPLSGAEDPDFFAEVVPRMISGVAEAAAEVGAVSGKYQATYGRRVDVCASCRAVAPVLTVCDNDADDLYDLDDA